MIRSLTLRMDIWIALKKRKASLAKHDKKRGRAHG